MKLSVELIVVLLLLWAVVSMLSRRLGLPYTVGLVVAGFVFDIVPATPEISLTKELIFTTLLPPLIFEAAFEISWLELRQNLQVILTLATLGVLLSAGLTATGIHFIVGWSWTIALLLGVLLSATDPVSVIATFKEAGVEGRLRLLVEAESLFNDGTVAVLFGIALAAQTGGQITGLNVAQSFIVTVFGGILCGALVGGGMLALAGQTKDHLVEITFTTITAYGSFLLAEHFHLSGVLATLTAGIIVGNIGSLGLLSNKGREAVVAFWEYVAFIANSFIFLLIGSRLPHHNFAAVWSPAVTIIFLVLLGRMVAVYGCCAMFRRSPWQVQSQHQHILVWGGLRGALALALVLGLPPDIPQRETIITVTYAVVVFSVVVQGLTLTPLLYKLGQIRMRPKEV